MTPAARLSAAIEVFDDIVTRRRPAADALKDWGLARRFAGSGDRAAIAGLVYDALRRRASAAWLMGGDSGRAVLLGTLRLDRRSDVRAIAALCSGERFAPAPLSDGETERLGGDPGIPDAPSHVRADCPEWLAPSLERAFGSADMPAEMAAFARRAPLDLRVNVLKASREMVAAELGPLGALPTPHSPWGLRIEHAPGERAPSIHADPTFLRGEIEIQDEGSQLACLLGAAEPAAQVVDLCAGAGGKTLALAAMMGNGGQIYATDLDARRLAPMHERLGRAGTRNIQVRTPRGKTDAVADLDGGADLVLVDAPCTGSGTWRRNPDAKWRVRPGSLDVRVRDQATVLDRAARLVRPGGRIAYITCSVLPEENDEAVEAFLRRGPGRTVLSPDDVLATSGLTGLRDRVRITRHGLQMSPLRTGTDGFYISLLRA